MESIEDLILALDFERLAGTSGEDRAVTVIVRNLEAAGLVPVLEDFEFMGAASGAQARIRWKTGMFQAFPFGLSPNLNASGTLVFVENPAALALSRQGYPGKIILSCGTLPEIQSLLQEAGAAGFISIGPPHAPAMAVCNRQHHYPDQVVPAVTVAHDTGLDLLAAVGQTVEIRVDQTVAPRTGTNIRARIPGTGPDRSLTLICAHYDTVARSPGSNDNAGGVVATLKTLAHFARNRPCRNLEAIFFSGEELGLLGSLAYTRRHRRELDQYARLVLNIDGAGDALGVNKAFSIGTREMAGYVDGVLRETGLYFEQHLETFNSDCLAFAAMGIPSVSLEKCLGKGSFFYHTPADTAAHTSARGLEAPIKAAKGLLDRILNAGLYPVDRQIDPALGLQVEKLICQYTGQPPGGMKGVRQDAMP